jgi:plastocyanin
MMKFAKAIQLSALPFLILLGGKVLAQGVDVTGNIRVNENPSAGHTKHPSVGNVVLWLTPLDTPLPPPVPKLHIKLVQKNKEFTPHLLVVPTGTSVDFPNMDPFFHNVFSLFNGKRFDLGLYEAGSHRSVSFDREGVSYIFCNIHPEMGAVVVALNSPYYATSSPDGSIALHDVPPGRYRVQTWAEQLQAAAPDGEDRIVQVTSKGAALGTIALNPGVDALAHHKNKFGKEYPPSLPPQY